MRAIAALALLVACSDGPATTADAGPDAMPQALALEVGSYELEWTCLDGCGPLLFPPGVYNRLDVDPTEVRWFTEDATGDKLASATEGDDGCVVTSALTYSDGATGEIVFCPELGGPVAEVTYTAEFGPSRERRHQAKALPL